MKVVIIEDNTTKAGMIAEAVEQAGAADDDVIIVPDLQRAKTTLETCDVALLILDLRIPTRFDRPPIPHGGIDLLEWIDHEALPRAPLAVIALSEMEIDPEVQDELLRRGVVYIRFERSNSSWREFLVAYATRILQFDPMRRIDTESPMEGVVTVADDCVVILTSVEVELEHALRVFSCQTDTVTRCGATWYVGTWHGNGKAIKVAVTKAPQMGMPAAAILCAQACSAWKPKLVIMVGICAGIEGESALGDVIIADPAWDYGSGKQDAAGNFHPDPRQLPLNARVRNIADTLSRTPELPSLIRDWPAHKPDRTPRVRRCPAASGASVVMDPAVTLAVQSQSRKVAAIDMEVYGFYYAAASFASPTPDFVSIKTVVDHANAAKNDSIQDFGAYLSCKIAGLFAERWCRETG